MNTNQQGLDVQAIKELGLDTLFRERDDQLKQSNQPQSISDLESLLGQDGKQWRAEHQEELKNGNIKQHFPSPRAVADILEKRLVYGIIANDDGEMERGQVSFYDPGSGIYRESRRMLKKLATCVERGLTARQQEEVINYLSLDSHRLNETRSKWLIPVNNGVFNQQTKQLEPFTPKYVFRHKVMTDYRPDVTEPSFNGWTVSSWFKQIAGDDQDKLKLIWQTISAVVNPNLTTDVAIILVDSGQGRTGKSTFERLLENLVGAGNYGSLKLKEFEDDFKLASATGKALIIGDDNNPNDYNRTSENFKSVATGENILLNPKGMAPFNYRFNNMIIQSMNGIPRFSDTSDALFRRLRVIVFNHQYEATAANKRIKDEYIKDRQLLEFLLKKALSITPDVLQDTAESQQIIQDVKEDNDSVAYFINHYLDELESTRVPVAFLFKYFLAAMEYENNPQKLKQPTFTRRAKPLMSNKGWEYSRNNLAPRSYWSDSDMDILNQLDQHYKYGVKVNPDKYQPLFENQQSTNNKNEK